MERVSDLKEHPVGTVVNNVAKTEKNSMNSSNNYSYGGSFHIAGHKRDVAMSENGIYEAQNDKNEYANENITFAAKSP